jgi:hypothetical protein
MHTAPAGLGLTGSFASVSNNSSVPLREGIRRCVDLINASIRYRLCLESNKVHLARPLVTYALSLLLVEEMVSWWARCLTLGQYSSGGGFIRDSGLLCYLYAFRQPLVLSSSTWASLITYILYLHLLKSLRRLVVTTSHALTRQVCPT